MGIDEKRAEEDFDSTEVGKPARPARPASPARPAGKEKAGAAKRSGVARASSGLDDTMRQVAEIMGDAAVDVQAFEADAECGASGIAASSAGERTVAFDSAAQPSRPAAAHVRPVAQAGASQPAATHPSAPRTSGGRGFSAPRASAPTRGAQQKSAPAKQRARKAASGVGSFFAENPKLAIVLVVVLIVFALEAVSCVDEMVSSVKSEWSRGASSSWSSQSEGDSYGKLFDSSEYDDRNFSYSDEEDAAASAAAQEILEHLSENDAVVTYVAASLSDQFSDSFGFTADEAGISSRSLAAGLIGAARVSIEEDNVFTYDNGTATVYADATRCAAYEYLWQIEDLAYSRNEDVHTRNAAAKKAVAALAQEALASTPRSNSFISFELVKKDGAWVLDERAFEDTADHLFGL